MPKLLGQNEETRPNAWRILLSDRDRWDPKAARAVREDKDVASDAPGVLGHAEDELLDHFFAVLSPSPYRFLSRSKDLSVLKKAISSVVEAMEEGILMENEASALIEFLATKFVQRRFETVLDRAFDVSSRQRFRLHAFRETNK